MKIILIIALCCFCCSCSFLNMFRTQRMTKNTVTSAVRYRQNNKVAISVGMSSSDVLFLWGQPSRINKPDIKNEYNHYSDEYWIYSSGTFPGVGEKDVSYNVYFQKGRVSEIVETLWEGRFLIP